MSVAEAGAFRLGDVFGSWFVGMRRGFLPLFPVAAACLALSLLPYFAPWQTDQGVRISFFLQLPFNSLYANLLHYVAQALIFSSAYRAVSGEKLGIAASARQGLVSLPSLILLVPISWIAIFMGLAVFLIPGIVIFTVVAVVVPACVVERIGPFAAFSRSAELTNDHRWQILGLYLVRTVLSYVVSIGATMLMFRLIPAQTLNYTAAALFALRAAILVIATLFDTAIYHGLRMAKEGAPAARIAAVFD